MGNEWQDQNTPGWRQERPTRQPQNPQAGQRADDASWQDWKRKMSGDLTPRAPENWPPESPPPAPPRQSGALAPHNGSGLLSRARNGGTSGPLTPPERSSRQVGPNRTSGPLGPAEGGVDSPPPRRSGLLSRAGEFAPGAPGGWPPEENARRPMGRIAPNLEPDGGDDATLAATNGNGRGVGTPPGQGRGAGGGLLSFARAASNRMRALITGNHPATRPGRPSRPVYTPPPATPEAEGERRHSPPPRYRRSRARLVIHKRLERRSKGGKKALISSIVTGVVAALVVGVAIFGFGTASAFYQDSQNKLGALANPNAFPLTTRIYDRNGVLLDEFKGPDDKDRIYVQYGQIPDIVKKATVDTEDNTFWTNSGVDLLSIIRAGLADVTSQQTQQGASTITQQLIKNAFFLDPKTGIAEQTIQRKIQEAVMSYAVTNRYSKQDILEFYLNIIFYGYFSAGIEAAAENMFDLMPKVDPTTHQLVMGVQQLDLAQAAMLAGLPQSPTDYAPCGTNATANRTAALQRMHDVVLASMLRFKDITQKDFDQADAEAHKDGFFKCRDLGAVQAPHFVDYVVQQLAMMLTDDGTEQRGEDILAHAGLNVYTTIDLRLEQYAEQTVHHYLYENHAVKFDYDNVTVPLSLPQSQGGRNIHDAAVVVIDPRNGDILAMDGSADYNSDQQIIGGQYNAATAYLQSGSSFKAIVYATAFEMGWFPGLTLHDQQTCFPLSGNTSDFSLTKNVCGPYYAPNNYDLDVHWDSDPNSSGSVTTRGWRKDPNRLETGDEVIHVRDALGNSFNIPAVQTIYFAGIDNVINMAHRLGIYSDPSQNGKFDDFSDARKGPALALGSARIQLLDLTDAYATFSNEGFHVPPRAILLVTDSQGNVIPGGDFSTVTRTQVLSPQTCFMLTSILADNRSRQNEFGRNNALWLGDQPFAAAKTGTTENFKDNLTLGYTPYLAVGVWAGNGDGSPMAPATLGITGAAPIWHDVVDYASNTLYKYPNSYWPVPDGVHKYTVDGLTGLAPYQGQTGAYSDWFNDLEVPTSVS